MCIPVFIYFVNHLIACSSVRFICTSLCLAEITKRSFILEDYKQILAILARRLHSEPNQWRHVYKSLLLLEYMAKNGPERMVSELKSNGRVFAKLQSFHYVDSQNRDQGINVRNRCASQPVNCFAMHTICQVAGLLVVQTRAVQ
jgi:hypothetical protein